MLKLLQLFIVSVLFRIAAGQTPISTTTVSATFLPSTVSTTKKASSSSSSSTANSIMLTASSAVVYSGSPLNFTCTFKTLPKTDNIYFVISSNYLSRTVAQVSTRLMAAVLPIDIRQRMSIYLLDDGVSLLFDYANTVVADTGTYRCYISGGAGSNSVSVTVNYNQPVIMTTGQPISIGEDSITTSGPIVMPYSYSNFDYGTPPTGTVNIPLVVTITAGAACVITACILFALRLKYRKNFCRHCKTRSPQPPSYVNATGSTNPVYTVDTEQLPSYVDAIKIADQFMPPSYNDVMTSPAVPSAPSAPTPEAGPTTIV